MAHPDDDDSRGAPYSSSAPPQRVSVIVPPPDVAEALREAQEGPPESRSPETLEPCGACSSCLLCGGVHMTTATRNKRWRATVLGTK